jgi:hypothetical protein
MRQLTAANGYANSFDSLPARANCSIVETGIGGASANTMSKDSTPLASGEVFALGGDGSESVIDLLNTFDLSAMRLTKRVIGTAVGDQISQEFQIALECYLDVNGAMRAIDIRDGADRTIRDREVVVYEDLPATAQCSLSETGNGGANVVAMTLDGLPIAGTTLTMPSGTSESTLANTYLLALTGGEPLPWILVGGQLLLVGGVIMFVASRRRRESQEVAE